MKRALFAGLLALLFPFELSASQETKVLYFGGHGFSRANAEHWEKCAKAKRPEGYEFQAFPYLGVATKTAKAFSAQQAVAGASRFIPEVVREIGANPGRSFVLAGHSSGSAITNEVMARLKSHANVRLVTLDGFFPRGVQDRPGVHATCWWAENAAGLRSLNAKSMRGNCRNSRRFADEARRCQSKHCLHFLLVMLSTPRNLGKATYASQGYQGCDPNLIWLDEE